METQFVWKSGVDEESIVSPAAAAGLLQELSVDDELSVEQLDINKQLQEDELLAMEAIYGDYLTVFTREGNQYFQIQVHLEGSDEFTVSAKITSFDKNVKFGENPTSSIDAADDSNNHLYSFKVAHLPPIVLTCLYPKSYPSHQPPYFTISSQWLDSHRISNLCRMLDSFWTKQPGQEIIYQWAEWLHTSSLPFLGFEKEIILDVDNLSNAGDRPDSSILSMGNYNDERCREVFLKNLHECCICFSEFPGTEFMMLPCKHLFCRKCMETYSKIHVKEGTVNKLLCPDAKCGGLIPPGLLQGLLGNEQFERWESLLLQKTLDSMDDVVYCPRCETTSIKDADHHAQCPMCLFSFCSICKQKRHVGTACVVPEIEMELETLMERQSSSQVSDAQKLKELAKINNLLSMRELESNAKQCPTCSIWISRTWGCNRMTCRHCGDVFCYRCGKRISAHSYSRSQGCPMLPPVKIEKQKKRVGPLHPCPICKQMNAKVGDDNRVFCSSCLNNYCYLCKRTVVDRSHFGPKGCARLKVTDYPAFIF